MSHFLTLAAGAFTGTLLGNLLIIILRTFWRLHRHRVWRPPGYFVIRMRAKERL